MLFQTLPKHMLSWLTGQSNKKKLPPFAEELGDLLGKYVKNPDLTKDDLVFEMSIWICCLILHEQNPRAVFNDFREALPVIFEKCFEESLEYRRPH